MSEAPPNPIAAPQELDLCHRSERVVVVNKPSGMLVHRGWAQDDVVLVDLLHAQLGQRVWPIHRLDRGTSGAVLFALDAEAARSLSQRFEAGEVRKRYLALVRGHPAAGEHLIDYSLRRVDHKSKERQEAQTRVRVLDTTVLEGGPRGGLYALMEAEPLTGRTHQIRRHLKHVAHPIIGDVRYGKGEHNRFFRAQYGLHRLALHALKLRLEGPEGETLEVTAPLPREFDEALRAMSLNVPKDLPI